MQTRASLLILGSLILSACASSLSNPPQSRFNHLTAQSRVAKAPLEQRVEKGRMEKHLAALSGKTALGASGVIPERGSAQGRNQTRAYLAQALTELGYKPERHEYRANGTNMTARLLADKPTDEYIVVGAHMDSVKNPGANDNGTGTVAVLEAAAVLKDLPNRQVNFLFAWFDEEEIGLVGSRYLAKELRKQGMKISSMHNIDMLGWDGDKDQAIELAQADANLFEYYSMVNQTHGFKLPLERTNTGQSDHESFHKEGFNAICISEEYTSGDMTPHYHRRTDAFETVNLDYLTHSTRFVVAVLGDLAQKVPLSPQFMKPRGPNSQLPSRLREHHGSYDEAMH